MTKSKQIYQDTLSQIKSEGLYKKERTITTPQRVGIVTKEGGEAEIMNAMSWKKLFKKLLMKYPTFSGWCSYMNKKGHLQNRAFKNGKETRK